MNKFIKEIIGCIYENMILGIFILIITSQKILKPHEKDNFTVNHFYTCLIIIFYAHINTYFYKLVT